MKMTLIAAAVLVVALPGLAPASGDGWYADYDEAVKVAKEEGKDLFIDFTGSDWCGWCKRLDSEVFEHAAFLDAVKKNYVLVALDFPRSPEAKAAVPNPARNEEIKNRYGIRGFPTILLTDVDGNVFARTGYQRGGAESYVKHLAELRATGRTGLEKALAARKAAETATGEERVAALGAALDLMEEAKGEAYASVLVPAAKAAIAADSDGTLGLRSRALDGLLAAGEVDSDVKSAVLSIDPKNEQGLYERYVAAAMGKVSSKEQLPGAVQTIEDFFAAASGIKDPKHAIQFRASAAFWSFKFLEEPERAKKHAMALQALNPENPKIQKLIKTILG